MLAILYDLSLAITGETRVPALVDTFLKRLVYHTGFSCAVLLTDIGGTEPAAANSSQQPVLARALIGGVYGNRDLQRATGERVMWPAELVTTQAALVTRTAKPLPQFEAAANYAAVLCLPVEGIGQVLLFSAQAPKSETPLEHVFAPVLASFARAYRVYRENADSMARLEHEVAVRRRAELEAERANRAKSEFLSSMSHELRTPLNAILGFAQLLQMDDAPALSPAQMDNLDEILSAGNHLLTLINDLLDLARIEAGKLDLSIEPVGLDQIVKECLALVMSAANQRRIEITTDSDCCGAAMMADRVRLKQVLLNLMSNAVKYNKDGGTIELRCLVENDRVIMEVIDSGIGIPASRQHELFDEFNRLDADRANVEGAGIGLVITRRLVEMMDGDMGFSSTHGMGSCFWFSLPHAQLSEVAIVEHHPVVTQAHGTATVLYIEDNPANQRLVHQVFQAREDIDFYGATDGDSGLKLALEHAPSVILIDINLPGMNGYELLQRIKAEPALKEARCIAISANAMPEDKMQGEQAGFDAYLTKPINISKFISYIDGLLGEMVPVSP